ncbi:MAG: signal peptide peptidase SppA, partial [Fischerella sp.]|nr:signal peptide peptidase SppA [Fischerella sp.]
GLDAAIAYAAGQAKLGKDWQLQEYPQFETLGERLFGRPPEEMQAAFKLDEKHLKLPAPLIAELQKLQAEFSMLQKMNDPQGVYARLPFNLKIE